MEESISETENVPTIEWYNAQVNELKEIRKYIYSLISEKEGNKDSYFPDLVKWTILERDKEIERINKSRIRVWRALVGCLSCKKVFTIQEALGLSNSENPLITDLENKIKELEKTVEFWMGDGDGSEWPPEN